MTRGEVSGEHRGSVFFAFTGSQVDGIKPWPAEKIPFVPSERSSAPSFIASRVPPFFTVPGVLEFFARVLIAEWKYPLFSAISSS